MKPGRTFAEAEKAEIWDRIEAGQSPRSVAISMGRFPSAIEMMQRVTGGVRPQRRHHRETGLSWSEREGFPGAAARESCRAIAGRLNRAPCTITREVERNGGLARYRAHEGGWSGVASGAGVPSQPS